MYQNPGRRWSSLQLDLGAEADSLNWVQQQQHPPEWRCAPRVKGTPLLQMLKMSEGVLENAEISAAVELGIALALAMIEQLAPWHSVPGKDSLKPQTILHHSSCRPGRGVVLPSKPAGADRGLLAAGNQLDTQRKHGHGFCSLYFNGNRQLQG